MKVYDDRPVIPQISLEGAISCAEEMASAKEFGELRQVSPTRYETQMRNGRQLFMQTPDDPANVYTPEAFRPVMADPKGYRMPPKAYRIGYINQADPSERLIGYVWSEGKSKSLRKEWMKAIMPRER